MKINAEIFLENSDQHKLINNIILISGNEVGLISKIQENIVSAINSLQKIEIAYCNFKNQKNNLDEIFNSDSLFGNLKILIFTNITDSKIEYIKNLESKNETVIIRGENIKSNSKIKKYFDSHRSFLSITCYKLTKNYKKRFVDNYLNKEGCKLTKEAYWFLLENGSEEYRFLEGELQKVVNFSKNPIELDQIRKLLSNHNQIQLDDLFFASMLGNLSLIINKTQLSIQSSSDAYGFLNIVKNFSNILVNTSENKSGTKDSVLVEKYLPKYLFRHKESFRVVLKKMNIKKLTDLNKLIQKTEFLLRKNDQKFLIIIQRFLLNCAKILR